MKKASVLFVCTHNSSRSQMAEGLVNALYGDAYQACSAGTAPTTVHPFTIAAMRELDIDITHHQSKHVDDVTPPLMDYVVTVCDGARDNCPYVASRKRSVHQSFRDPSAARGSDDEKLAAFREVRDQIREWLDTFLPSEPHP